MGLANANSHGAASHFLSTTNFPTALPSPHLFTSLPLPFLSLLVQLFPGGSTWQRQNQSDRSHPPLWPCAQPGAGQVANSIVSPTVTAVAATWHGLAYAGLAMFHVWNSGEKFVKYIFFVTFFLFSFFHKIFCLLAKMKFCLLTTPTIKFCNYHQYLYFVY